MQAFDQLCRLYRGSSRVMFVIEVSSLGFTVWGRQCPRVLRPARAWKVPVTPVPPHGPQVLAPQHSEFVKRVIERHLLLTPSTPTPGYEDTEDPCLAVSTESKPEADFLLQEAIRSVTT